MTSPLARVNEYLIEAPVIAGTVPPLQLAGRRGCEAFVLWAGVLAGSSAVRITQAIVPAQRAVIASHGVSVEVDGVELFRINQYLHERALLLVAQVHSHPTEAYHSSTDDRFPIATLEGSLSVVLPDFARFAPADLDKWAWYRLSKRSEWTELDDSIAVSIV